jgi:acyl-CoA reductase-like NAD-dependent aldehyde dehydrogenase
MTPEQQEQMAVMLENAAEIMRSDKDAFIKINTLERIGGTASYFGRKWGDETYNKFINPEEESNA